MKRSAKWLLAAALAALAIGAAAPLFSADRFARRIRVALEESLGRPVRLGNVRLSLLTGPGFSVRDVVIEEHPSIGLEPIAYVSSLEARVSWRSILTGNLQFSTLRLVEPSVNLVKHPSGVWNLRPLLGSPSAARIPDIQVRAGRLNFRLGDTKSAFYVTNADVDVTPLPDGFAFRFLGEPARTDRLAQGFGRLSGRGRWVQATGRVDAEVALQPSNVAELMILLAGRDVGMHGLVASQVRLTGGLDALDIKGDLQIEDVHRWDIYSTRGVPWPLKYRGRLDFTQERLSLETDPGADSPLGVRMRASLSGRSWGAAATFRSMPAAPLIEILRHLAAPIPAGLALEGRLDGAVGYSSSSGLQGEVTLTDATLRAPEAPVLACNRADLILTHNHAQLRPAAVRFDESSTAQLEGSLSWMGSEGDVDVRLETRGIELAVIENSCIRLIGAGRIPFLEQFQGGEWKGVLRYLRKAGKEGHWAANGEIANARLSLPELSNPVRIHSAAITVDDARAVLTGLQASAGEVAIEGDYRYIPDARRPHRFRLSVPVLDAAELERQLRPLLRRDPGFLARLGLGRQSLPEWIRNRRAEGSIEAGEVRIGEAKLEAFRAHVVWQGASAELSDVECRVGEGEIRGSILATLGRRVPSYRLKGAAENIPWRGGHVGLEFASETSGIGPDLLLNLKAEGSVTGRSLALLQDSELRALSGSYQFTVERGIPRVRFSSLEITLGEETYVGSGGSDSLGRLQFDFVSGPKPLRMSGSLVPLELDVVAAR